MVGAIAAAIVALSRALRVMWKTFVAGVEKVIESSISRVWADMDHIESRLDRLEQQVNELREQVSALRDLLMAHVAEMTRRHGE